MRTLIMILTMVAIAFAGVHSPVMSTADRWRELFLALIIWGSPVWICIGIWLAIVLPIKFIIYICKNASVEKGEDDFKGKLLDELEE